MACDSVRLPNGAIAIVCSRGGRRLKAEPCSVCGKAAGRLCDFPTGKGRTCDAPLCSSCSTKLSGDRDLCPDHAKAWGK